MTKYHPHAQAAIEHITRLFVNRDDLAYVAHDDIRDKKGKRLTIAVTPESMPKLIAAHLFGTGAIVLKNEEHKPTQERIHKRGWHFGQPAIDKEGRTKWSNGDFDGGVGHRSRLANAYGVAVDVYEKARRLDLTAYLEKSRSGYGWHLWIFYEHTLPVLEARALVFYLFECIDAPLESGGQADPWTGKGLEVFPKQIAPTEGSGSQVFSPQCSTALPTCTRFFDPDTAREIPLSDIEYCDPEALAKVIPLALAYYESNRPKYTKRTPNTSATVQFSGEGPWQEEVIERCADYARDLDSRTFFFSSALAVACYVNGGLVTEEWAREQLWKACEANGSAARFLADGGLKEFERQWQNALNSAWPKENPLPSFYFDQLKQAQKEADTAPKEYTPQEAEPILIEKINEGLNGDEILLLAAGAGLGKTRAANYTCKERIEKDGRTVALLSPTHKKSRESFRDALELKIEAKRVASPVGPNAFFDSDGNRICKLPEDEVSAEINAGRIARELCFICQFRNGCDVAKGFEGTQDAPLVLGCHQTNQISSDDLIVDEGFAAIQAESVSLAALKALADGYGHIKDRYALTFAEAASVILRWLPLAEQQHPDLSRFEIGLLESCTQKDGRIRALVPRTLQILPGHSLYKSEVTHQDQLAWQAANWLQRATLAGRLDQIAHAPRVGTTKELGAAYLGQHVLIERIKARGRAVILDATPSPGDIRALEFATGLPVRTERLGAKDSAPVRREWWPTRRLGRKYIADQDLIYTLSRLTDNLQTHPDEKRLLIGCYMVYSQRLNDLWTAFETNTTPPPQDKILYDAALPLFTLLQKQGGTFAAIWYGNLRGLNLYADYDLAVSIGDPFVGSDLAAQLADLPSPVGQAWLEALGKARDELAQFFARLRTATRTTPCRMIAIGAVLPRGWTPAQVTVVYRPKGRPARPAPTLPWQAALEAILARHSQRWLLDRLSLNSKSALARWRRGTCPSPLVCAQLIEIAQPMSAPINVASTSEEDTKSTDSLISIFGGVQSFVDTTTAPQSSTERTPSWGASESERAPDGQGEGEREDRFQSGVTSEASRVGVAERERVKAKETPSVESRAG